MMLVDSLLKYPDSMAAVVDSTGNFDVLGVYTGILEKLKGNSSVFRKMKAKEEDTVEEVAARALDRVKMMRVFDFVGVREAIGEIRDDLERKKAPDHKTMNTRRQTPMISKPATPKRPTPEPLTPEPQLRRTAVADSEDEDEEDEEMLFDTIATSKEPTPAPAVQEVEPEPETELQQQPTKSNKEQEEAAPSSTSVKFILIDNLAQVLNPLLKKDYIQGTLSLTYPFSYIYTNNPPANALSSTFLHTLTHLTRTHTLHTILANPAPSPRALSPTRQLNPNPTSNVPQPPQQNKQPPPPPPSIFASNALIPSLTSVLARYVDVGMLMSQLPKRKMDARVYYRDGNEGVKKLRGVEMVSVVEVVSDRWEGRGGGWGTL